MVAEKVSLVEVPAFAPPVYWEGWATTLLSDQGNGLALLATVRRGVDGESDARFIVDRLASGLYFGKVL